MEVQRFDGMLDCVPDGAYMLYSDFGNAQCAYSSHNPIGPVTHAGQNLVDNSRRIGNDSHIGGRNAVTTLVEQVQYWASSWGSEH